MTTGREGAPGEEPRTDLPPRREPYDDDWFGTGEEEGAVRETEAPPEPAEPRDEPERR